MAEERPVTLPEAKPVKNDPCIVNPTDSYEDLAADKKRKRKTSKKVPEVSKKKARKNLTLELPKGTVRFDEIVLA